MSNSPRYFHEIRHLKKLEEEVERLRARNAELLSALQDIAESEVHWRAVNIARFAIARAEGK